VGLGFVAQLVWLFPFFLLLNTGNVGLIIIALLLFTVGLGITYGPLPALYAEMFPPAIRYSGASLAYAAGSVLGGAFAPTIAQALQTSTGTVYSVAAYLSIVTVISLAVTFFVGSRVGGGRLEPVAADLTPMSARET
jgi:MFS family permease